jgi:hypothetical protein
MNCFYLLNSGKLSVVSAAVSAGVCQTRCSRDTLLLFVGQPSDRQWPGSVPGKACFIALAGIASPMNSAQHHGLRPP